MCSHAVNMFESSHKRQDRVRELHDPWKIIALATNTAAQDTDEVIRGTMPFSVLEEPTLLPESPEDCEQASKVKRKVVLSEAERR